MEHLSLRVGFFRKRSSSACFSKCIEFVEECLFRIPFSSFCIPYSIFRIPCFKDRPWLYRATRRGLHKLHHNKFPELKKLLSDALCHSLVEKLRYLLRCSMAILSNDWHPKSFVRGNFQITGCSL